MKSGARSGAASSATEPDGYAGHPHGTDAPSVSPIGVKTFTAPFLTSRERDYLTNCKYMAIRLRILLNDYNKFEMNNSSCIAYSRLYI